jgi:hypothetical protein
VNALVGTLSLGFIIDFSLGVGTKVVNLYRMKDENEIFSL